MKLIEIKNNQEFLLDISEINLEQEIIQEFENSDYSLKVTVELSEGGLIYGDIISNSRPFSFSFIGNDNVTVWSNIPNSWYDWEQTVSFTTNVKKFKIKFTDVD